LGSIGTAAPELAWWIACRLVMMMREMTTMEMKMMMRILGLHRWNLHSDMASLKGPGQLNFADFQVCPERPRKYRDNCFEAKNGLPGACRCDLICGTFCSGISGAISRHSEPIETKAVWDLWPHSPYGDDGEMMMMIVVVVVVVVAAEVVAPMQVLVLVSIESPRSMVVMMTMTASMP